MSALKHLRPIEVTPEVERDPRWELVERVLSSSSFVRSARLRDFLCYVCALAITGREEEIVEQNIGVHVFGKHPDYNPGDDNTVRVQARLLRQKLTEHFSSDGAQEPIVIEVPKGGYIPLFHSREHYREASPLPASTANPPVSQRRTIGTLAALVCALTGVSIWLWTQNRELRTAVPLSDAQSLTSLVIRPSEQNYVVVADSGLVMAQVLTNSNITLDQYSGPWYRTAMAQAGRMGSTALGLLLTPRYTSMADLAGYGKLLRSHPQAWKNLHVRHARAMQTRDFKQGNFMLLGSPRSNPWVDLFSPQLNFAFGVKMENGLSFIRNKSPRAGEQPEYVSDPTPNSAGTAYAHIAFLPSLGQPGRVLILSGTTSPGTEAAVEFATDPAAYREVGALLGQVAPKDSPQFEVLLQVTTIEDTAKEWKVIAFRTTPGPGGPKPAVH